MFDSQDFLRLADWLEREGTASGVPEAAYRTVVSRAYYSVYGRARLWVEEQSHAGSLHHVSVRGGSHARVWQTLLGQPVHELRRIGLRGDHLRSQRVRADYDLIATPDWDNLARWVIQDAREVPQLLDQLR